MRSGSGKQKKAIADKSNRKCFQVPSTEAYGAIRINLIDREPHGKIQAGQEYEAFCEELIRDLSAIVNLNTGEPLIKNILRSEEIYQGKQPMGCPDLLIEWNRNAPISSIGSPKIGRIDKVYWDSRTGDHKPGGLFSILGPSIEPRKLEEPTSIIDFAPTIASLLGIKLSSSDGQILSII
jgi:predicted AlkP superfamily phosphohydrolase/phosphomutase